MIDSTPTPITRSQARAAVEPESPEGQQSAEEGKAADVLASGQGASAAAGPVTTAPETPSFSAASFPAAASSPEPRPASLTASPELRTLPELRALPDQITLSKQHASPELQAPADLPAQSGAPASARAMARRRRLDTPWRYEFAQLVRQLTGTSQPGGPPLGHHDIQHRIQQLLRFSSPPQLRFPPGEISHCQTLASEDPLQPLRHQIGVNFVGLVGPSGALPVAYTERLYQLREHHRETASGQFFDIFQHRLTSLFFSAMTRASAADLAARRTPAFTRLSRALAALPAVSDAHAASGVPAVSGVAPAAGNNASCDTGPHPDALLFYAGSRRLRPLPPVVLESLVASYFRVPVRVHCLQGAWLSLPRETLCGLGQARLDGSSPLGERCWDPQAGLRLSIGPLSRRQFLSFLPDQAGYRALQQLVASCLPALVECRLELLIDSAELPPALLGNAGCAAAGLGRLGWSQRLPGRPGLERFPLPLHGG